VFKQYGPREFERLKKLYENGEPAEGEFLKDEREKEIAQLESRLSSLKASRPPEAPQQQNPWLGGIGPDPHRIGLAALAGAVVLMATRGWVAWIMTSEFEVLCP
jgi:hypothetical protein